MKQETFVLKHFSDMSVEPTSLFVQIAGRFSSAVTVSVNDRSVNAKSLMGMMMLGLAEGRQISVTVDGSDEQAVLDALKKQFA